MKSAHRLTLQITETANNAYEVLARDLTLSLTLEDDGWLLSDGKRHANVTLLPGGGVDWQIMMEQLEEWR